MGSRLWGELRRFLVRSVRLLLYEIIVRIEVYARQKVERTVDREKKTG